MQSPIASILPAPLLQQPAVQRSNTGVRLAGGAIVVIACLALVLIVLWKKGLLGKPSISSKFQKMQYVAPPEGVMLQGLQGVIYDDISPEFNDANLKRAQQACANDTTCFALSHNQFGFAKQYRTGGSIDQYLAALSDEPVTRIINPETGKGFPNPDATKFWVKR